MRPEQRIMKNQSNHTGLWVGISLAIVVLAAAGIFLIRGLLRSGGSNPTAAGSSHEAAAPSALQTEPGKNPVSSAAASSEETEAPELPKELSEAELKQIDAVQLTLEALRVKAEYQAADPAGRAQQVLSVLDTLSAEGSVEKDSIYYDEEGGCVSYLLPGGVLSVEKLREEEDLDGVLPPVSSAAAALTASPNGLLPQNGFADAVILNGMTDRQNVMDYCRRLQSQWTQTGLYTDLDTDVTVEDMKNLADYEFVYVKTHGCFISRPQNQPAEGTAGGLSVIVLEQQQNASLNRAYQKDLANSRLVLVNGRYCITPGFIREYYGWGDLDGNIIFLGCCQLMGKDGRVWEGWTSAFEDCSLAAFVAFHNSNYTLYNLSLAETFVQELLSGRDVKTAYDAALARHGENDNVWFGNAGASRPAGTPLLRENSRTTLKNAPAWQAAYYGFILNGGYLNSGQRYDVDNEDMNLTEIAFALHDLDADGIPELIANAGYYAAGATGYFYAFRDGSVTYLGDGPENRSRLYYSPYEPGLFERMASGPAVDTVGHIYVYLYWALENGRPASRRIAEEYSDDPAKEIDDEALYLAVREAFDEETLIPWLTPDEIREMGWYEFIKDWEQRTLHAEELRSFRIEGLSRQTAQAFLDVLPKEKSMDGEVFITAAFPDMNRDKTPEMAVITRRTDNSYGITETYYTLSVYAVEDGSAQLKYRDLCFDHGGTFRTACRIYQTASGALVDAVAFLQALGAGKAFYVLSYENGQIVQTVLSEYEEGSPNPDTPSTFEYHRDQENLSEESYRQQLAGLIVPSVLEIFHAQDQWGGDMWEEFLGDIAPCGLSRSRTVRLLTEAGAVLRQTENVIASGSCGTDVSWTVNDESLMRISGMGSIEEYYRLPFVPWGKYAGSVRTIVIGDGVAYNGGYAFYEMRNVEKMYIGSGTAVLKEGILGTPDSLKAVYLSKGISLIEAGVFAECSSLTDVYFAGTEAEWAAVEIGGNNAPLLAAHLHFGPYPVP